MTPRTRRKLIALLLALCLLLSGLPGSIPPAKAAEAEKSPADDCKILDYVHEEVFEKGDHLGRMEEEETLSSYVFLNKDGSRTAYYLDEAVKFVDSDGKIKEKDITLKSVLGGYATTQNDVTVTLPITMSSGVNLSFNNHQISLIPENGSSAAPRIVNNAAEYENFYGADTTLKYTPTLSGVKEDIILESYTGVNTFTFILNTNGLNVYHTPEDRYYLAPGKGSDPVYWLGTLEIYDAALNMGPGTMTVDTLKAGQKYRITITVDTDWLTSASTVYPVTVDPSITVSYANNGSGYIDDAPIYSDYPSRNYGSNIYNCAGHMNGYGEGRTAIYLSGLYSNSSYNSLSASQLTSVTFYIADASGSSADTVYLHPLVDQLNWTETNVTYSNVGNFFDTAYASKQRSGGNYSEFDITVLAQKWKAGSFNSNYRFILLGSNTTSGSDALYSSEHSTTSRRPYVSVTYEESALYSEFDYATNSSVSEAISGSNTSHYCNTFWMSDTYTVEDFVNVDYIDIDVNLYHDDGAQRRANCYGYAFRFCYVGDFEPWMKTYCTMNGYSYLDYDYYVYKQQPGEFAPKSDTYTVTATVNGISESKFLTANAKIDTFMRQTINNPDLTAQWRLAYMYALLEADSSAFDNTDFEYDIEPINSNMGIVETNAVLPSASSRADARLIAVVITDEDYHFYMQHSDNTWSHKPGQTLPTTKSLGSGVTLTNSNIAACAAEGDYAGGIVGFFYINKSTFDILHGDRTGQTQTPIYLPDLEE